MDSTLAHIDQASFLDMRAHGHGPLIQFTWTYGNDVDLEALRRFRANLSQGIMGRRIECSPLPFGRHRWVAWPGPADIEVTTHARPRSEVPDWMEEEAARPIDPEHGPTWRLSVLPLSDGGSAVTLVAAHAVIDGVGLMIAVVDAINGVTHNLGYPEPNRRAKAQSVAADLRAAVRDVPEMAKALAAIPKAATELPQWGRKRRGLSSRAARRGGSRDDELLSVPWVTARVDLRRWDERAAGLGGTTNSLLVAFTSRLAHNVGWVAPDGSANLTVPVNDRIPGDTRGNALSGVALTINPEGVTADLGEVRSRIRQALANLRENPTALVGPLPLTPLIPKSATRRMQDRVLKSAVITCSNLGDLDPTLNRPDGTDADRITIRSIRMAQQVTGADLQRSGGLFFPVALGRIHGEVFLTVGYASADGSTTRAELAELVLDALAEFGLSGTID